MTTLIETEPRETALAVIDAEVLRIGDVPATTQRDVLAKAADAAGQLADIIRTRQLSKKIGAKEFVFVEGWTTCGAMFGIAIRPVECVENPKCDGEFVATVEAVRASDGFVLGRGIASCGPDERDWKSRSRQARRSMAQTRAAGKAMRLLFSWVMELAGYAPTPFEEMEGCQVEERTNPAENAEAPKAETRAKRGAADAACKERMEHVWAHWWQENQTTGGDVTASHTQFAEWVRRMWKAENANPRRPSEWTEDREKACCSALSIPTLAELSR